MKRFVDPVKRDLPEELKWVKRDFPDWKEVPRIVTYIQTHADLRIYEPRPRKKDGTLTLRCVGAVYLRHPKTMGKYGYALAMSRAVADALEWVYQYQARVGMTLDKTPDSFQAVWELIQLERRNDSVR